MKAQGTFYDPTLSVGEGFRDFAAGKGDLLKRSLVQQVATGGFAEGNRRSAYVKEPGMRAGISSSHEHAYRRRQPEARLPAASRLSP